MTPPPSTDHRRFPMYLSSLPTGHPPGYRSPLAVRLEKTRGSLAALPPAAASGCGSGRPITTEEFLREMLTGVPRGVERMANDAYEHPFVVGGTVGGVLALSSWLPNPYARAFSRGLLYLGGAVSTYFIGKGVHRGVEAWQCNDRAALREASTDFGVGTVSLGLALGGYGIAQRLGSTPEKALRWGVIGNLLHSSDEIAAALALSRGASNIR